MMSFSTLLVKSTPITPPMPSGSRKITFRLIPLSFKSSRIAFTMRSYNPMEMAMTPPLTPGSTKPMPIATPQRIFTKIPFKLSLQFYDPACPAVCLRIDSSCIVYHCFRQEPITAT